MKKLSSLLATVAAFSVCGIASLPAQAQTAASAPAPAASPRAADRLVAMCVGCHNIPGYQASFPEVYKVPMIAGQSASYIVAALTEYKKGERKHPTMRAIAGSLSEQDMNDVAAYYEQLGKQGEPAKVPDALPASPEQVQALLTKGACVSCHGANLDKPLSPTYPKIAGQHGDYLYAALKAYQTENNPRVGRSNPIMAAQAKQFSHAELKVLADYVSSLPGELKTVPESRFR